MRSRERSGFPSKGTRARPRATHASGERTDRALPRTPARARPPPRRGAGPDAGLRKDAFDRLERSYHVVVRRLLLLIFLCAASVRADDFRAFWVEAFKTPLATHSDIDRVLDAAGRANANALF